MFSPRSVQLFTNLLLFFSTRSESKSHEFERNWKFNNTEVVLTHYTVRENDALSYALCEIGTKGERICDLNVETFKEDGTNKTCRTTLSPRTEENSIVPHFMMLYPMKDKRILFWIEKQKGREECFYMFRIIDINSCEWSEVELIGVLPILLMDYFVQVVPFENTFDVFFWSPQKKLDRISCGMSRASFDSDGYRTRDTKFFPEEVCKNLDSIHENDTLAVSLQPYTLYDPIPSLPGYYYFNIAYENTLHLFALTPGGRVSYSREFDAMNETILLAQLREHRPRYLTFHLSRIEGHLTFCVSQRNATDKWIECRFVDPRLNVKAELTVPYYADFTIRVFTVSENEAFLFFPDRIGEGPPIFFNLVRIRADGSYSKPVKVIQSLEVINMGMFRTSFRKYDSQYCIMYYVDSNDKMMDVKLINRCVDKRLFDESV